MPPRHHDHHPPPPPPPRGGPRHRHEHWRSPVPMPSLDMLGEVADFDDFDLADAMHEVLDEDSPVEWAAATYFSYAFFSHLNRRLDAIERAVGITSSDSAS